MKIIITGSIGVGKSSLVNKLFMSMNKPLNGIRSVRSFQGSEIVGYDLKIIEDGSVKAEYPLMRFTGEINISVFEKCRNFIETFLKSDNKLIFIDELGRFEKDNKEYLESINKLLESSKDVILVLKKEDLPFNNYILNKYSLLKDVKIIDLDNDKLDNIMNFKKDIFLYIDNDVEDLDREFLDSIKNIDYKIFKNKKELENFKSKREKIIYCYSKDFSLLRYAVDLGMVGINNLEILKK